jgi:hypothetical protein
VAGSGHISIWQAVMNPVQVLLRLCNKICGVYATDQIPCPCVPSLNYCNILNVFVLCALMDLVRILLWDKQ